MCCELCGFGADRGLKKWKVSLCGDFFYILYVNAYNCSCNNAILSLLRLILLVSIAPFGFRSSPMISSFSLFISS